MSYCIIVFALFVCVVLCHSVCVVYVTMFVLCCVVSQCFVCCVLRGND